MLRTLPSRRRPPHSGGRPRVCAVVSVVISILTLTLLYFHLSISSAGNNHVGGFGLQHLDSADDEAERIDIVDEDGDFPRKPRSQDQKEVSDAEEEEEGEEEEEEEEEDDGGCSSGKSYFYDHVTGVIRRVFMKGSIEEWDDYASAGESSLGLGVDSLGDNGKGAFGSDDVAVDESVRRKVGEVKKIEEALLLRGSKGALREGWGEWFEKKGDFLRRDRMFRTGMEILNPMNNPMLQDPDSVGVSGLTRGDRLVQKWWTEELRKVPFPGVKKLLGI